MPEFAWELGFLRHHFSDIYQRAYPIPIENALLAGPIPRRGRKHFALQGSCAYEAEPHPTTGEMGLGAKVCIEELDSFLDSGKEAGVQDKVLASGRETELTQG